MSTQITQPTQLKPSRPTPPPRKSKARTRLLVFALIFLGLGALWFFVIQPRSGQRSQTPQFGRHAFMNSVMPVGIGVAEKGDIPITLEGLGTVTPLATVTVKTQLNGQLTQIVFTEGQLVKKGDFLAQIDPQIYQAQLEQYQGQLVRDQGLLDDARLDLARYKKLASQDSIAFQQVDTQEATVKQDEGNVLVDQAQIQTVKVNLAYCHIVSPVDGIVGIRQVDQGNYVQTSDANGIVVITQMQPMSVIFTVSEDKISKVVKRLRDGATLPVTAYDRTDTTAIASGTLSTTDNQVDTSTGTVKLRAMFPNDKDELFPQQFVNARLLVDTLKATIVVPTAAIQLGAPGSYVYVVNSDSTVSVRVVKTGPSDGQRTAIVSGLESGETVVTDGVDRLFDGARVQLPGKQPLNDPPSKPHQGVGRPNGSGSPREHHHNWNGNGNSSGGPQRKPPGASNSEPGS
ncbi:MAG TPA: MdtA/MuxA family multidrug efflux RND transporter periplasmic adaptor subunit [Chthoniobacterales bacterium]